MFTSELANIYSEKPFLNELIPYYEIVPRLEQFMYQEVRLGANNLNPYRFSFKFAYEPKNVIPLFIAFSSKEGPLKRLYKYECSCCEETNILDDEELKNFKCYYCGSNDDLETKNFLENVRVIFEIKEPYLKEVKTRLKEQASSRVFRKSDRLEEANKKDLSLKDIFEVNNKNTELADSSLLDVEKAIMHKISFGLESI